jgi:prolyl-tRNA editing enzyme YbaK/EbsC (Cys-tRNA(Pro) deacylase)
VAGALAAAGLAAEVREMPASTRTAEEAAAACGCPVAAIVKSLVFRDAETGAGVLVLASGANRVHEKRLGRALGVTLERADAAFVRAATGFAIGGVPPLGHAAPMRTVMDAELMALPEVWAAAGTPRAVFPAAPAALARATGAEIVSVT